MSKKTRKKAAQGTWTLCITVGLTIGLGLGALLESVMVTTLVGIVLGAGTANYLTRNKTRTK